MCFSARSPRGGVLNAQKGKRNGVDSVCFLSALVFCSNRVSHVPSGVCLFFFFLMLVMQLGVTFFAMNITVRCWKRQLDSECAAHFWGPNFVQRCVRKLVH